MHLDDPHVSPAYADPTGLPPLYLPVAQYDTVRQGVWTLAAAALDAGVDVTAESWPGTVHGWQGLVSAGVPEAEAWFVRAREYLDARCLRAEAPNAVAVSWLTMLIGVPAGMPPSMASSASCNLMQPCEIAAPVVPICWSAPDVIGP